MKTCKWIKAFDGHFNISCSTGQRAHGNFKKVGEAPSVWDFTYCPYCGGEIKVITEKQEAPK